MIPFNYHHLYYFYTVAKEGSVTAAARVLRIGQPALSTQIRQFETNLGARLFEREGKRLELTESGREILQYAEEIFEVGRQMMRSISGGGVKGELHTRLGLTSYVPKTIADKLIQFLFALDPGMRMEAAEDRLDRLLPRLEQHELDFVLSDEPAGSLLPTVQAHLLEKITLGLAASPELAKKYTKIPKDLTGAPMILPTSNTRIYAELQEYFAAHSIRPRVIAEVQDVELVRRMVIAGLGIAPMNTYTLKYAPGSEKMVALNSRPLPIHRPIYLFTVPRKRPHPMLDLVLNKFRLKV